MNIPLLEVFVYYNISPVDICDSNLQYTVYIIDVSSTTGVQCKEYVCILCVQSTLLFQVFRGCER